MADGTLKGIDQFLPEFLSEAHEHLEALGRNLVLLEKDAANPELLNEIFRSAHTLKGSSSFLGLTRVTRVAHVLEDVLDRLRKGTLAMTPEIMDEILSGQDLLRTLVEAVESENGDQVEIDETVEALRAIAVAEREATSAGEEVGAAANVAQASGLPDGAAVGLDEIQKQALADLARMMAASGPTTDEVAEEETTADSYRKYVVFSIGGRQHAFPVTVAREIIHLLSIAFVPGQKEHVRGIANMRGEILPILDLTKLLGIAATRPTCLIVLERSGVRIGVLLDEVLEVLTIDDAAVTPPPVEVDAGLVAGVFEHQGALVPVIRPEAVFA